MSIVQLCASHVDNGLRLRSLLRLLRSVVAQTVRVPMYLSVSCDPLIWKDAHTAIDVDQLQDYEITVRWRHNRMSQFEHYALLTSELGLKYEWCILCDDDDYCHPNRVAWYMDAVISAEDVVMCSDGSLNVHCIGATDLELDDLDTYAKENPDSLGRGGNEHWMYAARTRILRKFCNGIGMDVLKNVACDLVWRNLLRILDCKIVSTSTWVYAKTMVSSFGHASLSSDYGDDSIAAILNACGPLLIRIAGVSPSIAAERLAYHSSYWQLAGSFVL